ncbi:hypothetical protein ACP3V3_19755 [Vibrio sp. PNB22_3_1]
MTELFERCIDIQSEIAGSLLAIHPAYPDENYQDAVWLIIEDSEGDINSRQIVFRPRPGKHIYEADGPSETSCPLYFFELVEEVQRDEWRDRVHWYWHVMSLPDIECNQVWDAYGAGIDAYHDHLRITSNPHKLGTISHKAWLKGYSHTKRALSHHPVDHRKFEA